MSYGSYLISRFGGKRGLVTHMRAWAMFNTGWWQRCRNVEWQEVSRLVFVCKGNICRSPYGAVRARDAGLTATSFGIEAQASAPANLAAIRAARMRGVALETH